jgi:hypothetical protein
VTKNVVFFIWRCCLFEYWLKRLSPSGLLACAAAFPITVANGNDSSLLGLLNPYLRVVRARLKIAYSGIGLAA